MPDSDGHSLPGLKWFSVGNWRTWEFIQALPTPIISALIRHYHNKDIDGVHERFTLGPRASHFS